MSQDHDDPPDTEAIAELLTERYAIERSFKVSVERPSSDKRLILRIDRPRRGGRQADRLEIELAEAGGAVTWDLLVDALDALAGTLVESGYAHRELPAGPDVTFGDGIFFVRVDYIRPDLEQQAETLLGGDGQGE